MSFDRLRELLLPRRRPGSWPKTPRTRAHFLSVVLVAALLSAYTAKWATDVRGMLFDADCQTDDVRVGLAAFHRFDPEPLLTDDPLAGDLYLMYMPAVRGLYRATVPFVGLPKATKYIQGLALLLLAAASFVLLRSKRAGFAAAALLLFFSLHEPYVFNRIAGGLGRAFIFPFLALWLAGAIAKNERLRAVVTLVASISQANAALIMLGAEGLLVAWEMALALLRLGKKYSLRHPSVRRFLRLIVLGVFCFLLTSVYSATVNPQLGSFVSYEEASKNPAFLKGNYWENELPFSDPVKEFRKWTESPIRELGRSRTWAYLGIFLIAALALAARAHSPLPLALLCSSIVCYTAARILAFRLYSPERYYSFGGVISAIALFVVAVGCTQLFRKRGRAARATLRNYAAAALIAVVWIAAGRTGVAEGSSSCVITQKQNLPLYNFIRTLPKDVRILAHPHDADDIPWWTGRATTGGFEMCMVWFVDAHQRCMKTMREALLAYYAIDRNELYDYLEREKITHILVQRERVGSQFAVKSGVAEPLQSELKKWLAGKTPIQFMLARVPNDAVVFRHGNYELVEVTKLKSLAPR